MYAFSNANRVYIPFLLFLCATVLSSSALAITRTPSGLSPTVKTSINSGLDFDAFGRSSAPVFDHSTMESSATKSSNVKRGSNSGSISVKQSIGAPAYRRVAGSVLRGGFYGALAIEGIDALISEYQGYLYDYNEGLRKREVVGNQPQGTNSNASWNCPQVTVNASSYDEAKLLLRIECSQHGQVLEMSAQSLGGGRYRQLSSQYCRYTYNNRFLASTGQGSTRPLCNYESSPSDRNVPATQPEVDEFASRYNPAQSDFDALDIYLATGQKDGSPFDLDGVEYSEPQVSKELSTETQTVQSGDTTTVTTTQPSLQLSMPTQTQLEVELAESVTTEVYEAANLVSSNTVTTTNTSSDKATYPAVGESVGTSPSPDFELPSFCGWASVVCDWLGWTQEPLDEPEPDLSQLITVFEPDEDGYDVGIGSGSCPAPMQLNLGIINKTVEVKYDPFCDFLEMIRPFVLAAAYLFAAYLYLGVLRRG